MTPHSFTFLLYTFQMESGVNKENNIGFCFYLFKFILLPEKKRSILDNFWVFRGIIISISHNYITKFSRHFLGNCQN